MSSENANAVQERHVDPIIEWPSGSTPPLRDTIADIQRLNPNLGLRCAISTWEPDDTKFDPRTAAQIRKDMAESPPQEYLLYDGTAFDVVRIAMPYAPSDDAMSGFTDLNKDGSGPVTDLGDFEGGPRRIERLSDGGLLIRPRSEAVNQITGAFARAYQKRFEGRQQIDQILRFQRTWGVPRERHELWEVEFAYFLPDYLDRASNDFEYWHTTPVGTISYIDEYDLPIADHYARAEAIVAAGSAFAIVGDINAGELRIFK